MTMAEDPILWSAVIDAIELLTSKGGRDLPDPGMLPQLVPNVVDVKTDFVAKEVAVHFVDGSKRALGRIG